MDETTIERINLGHASAYAYYKAGGGTGTEEEFTQWMADLGIQVEYLENMAVVTNTLEPGTPASATYEDGVLTLNIPKGEKGDPAPADEVAEATDAWLAQNITNPSNPPLDRSLALENAAAPADMVGDLRSALNEVSGITEIPITTSGYYQYNSTAQTILDTPTSSGNYQCAKVECQEGDVFTISGRSYGNAARMYIFSDINQNALPGGASKDATYENKRIVAPASAAYLYINSYQSSVTAYAGIRTVEIVESNTNRIIAIEQDLYENVPLPDLDVEFSQFGIKGNDGTGNYNVLYRLSTRKTLPSFIRELHVTDAQYYFYLYAYNKADGVYVGAWNGETSGFVKSGFVESRMRLTDAVLKNFGDYNYRIQLSGPYESGDTMPLSDANKVTGLVLITDIPEKDIVSPENYVGTEISVFDKILCIGDSIIAGGANHPAGVEPDQGNAKREVPVSMYSIPTFITKMYGVTTTNWGISGATSRSWYNAKSDLDWGGYDAALIRIGNNDYTYAESDGLTPDECAALSKQYVELIIAKLKTDNPGIRIFLCTLNKSNSSDRLAEYRVPMMEAFREIAEDDASVFIVDTNIYSNYPTSGGYYNGHPTAIGYQLMAQDICNNINYIIANQPADFKWIRWIGTEYAVTDNVEPDPDEPDVG